MNRNITQDLVRWKNLKPRKPLILRGARQVGKTYALKQFGESAFPHFHYFNFEEDERLSRIFDKDLRPKRILTDIQFHQDISINPETDLVIFDEIQRCPRALTSLKYFAEETPDLALCAAGSLLGVTLGAESFPVGKVTFLDLMPMMFEEFLAGTESTRLLELLSNADFATALPETAHDQLWEMWKQYLVVGGLPEVVNAYVERRDNLYEAMQSVRKTQRDLLQTYLADIAKHSGKTSALHIERLWRNIPEQLALAQDASAPKFKFRESLPGVRGYERIAGPLDWLESAKLVIRTSIVNSIGTPLSSRRAENRFKLYFFDIGLLGAISGILPARILEYGFGTYQGYVAENFVAQELLASGIDSLYAWQGKTSEVEFVIEGEGGIVPFEVKSGRVTQSKSLGVFEEKFHPAHSYVLSARNVGQSNLRHYVPVYAAGRLSRRVLSAAGRL
ncbi:MAG: AAA family ATPase [Kiritimatiellae bacterium]|nr:AAA family ATPase [Kiritimatiellia bacterium]MDD5519506.1 AAA family ATPase [Kiritimatiellia bacterium]